MKNALPEGALLSHRYPYLACLVAAGILVTATGCNKEKEAPAIIEEVPAAAAPAETDTSATLAEEPNLQQVGQGTKPGSAKNTFHPSGSADKAGFSEDGRFVVQVAIFKSKRQAAALVEKLANSGYPAYVAEVENPVPDLPGTYHRVRIGKFLKIADARAFGDNTLKPLGYDFWVDNKKNDAVGGDGSGYTAPEPSYSAPVERAAPAPSEPSTPPGETWGTPAASEPATPAGETWGTPASDMPGAAPSEPANTAKTPKAPETPAATPPPADTGKVNLDEW